MTYEDILTSIGSYTKRRDERKRAAIDAINDNSFMLAVVALNEAAQYNAVVNEYEFQLEVMEVNNG